MRILPNTRITVPTTNDIVGQGIDGLETARMLIERGFEQVDKILGGVNESVIQNVKFDVTTNHGDFVYLREDGVYAPALAEFSVRKNAVGVADTLNKKVTLTGLAKYGGEISDFKIGGYLYLSPRHQGYVQPNAPINAPEVLVGIYLGDSNILISLTTAISDYLQKGIPDGSISTEKLAAGVIAPYSNDIYFDKNQPTASEAGLISLEYPEYKGELDKIFINSNYKVNSSNVTSKPSDFDLGTVGIIQTMVVSELLATQILWSISDSDNLAWCRRKTNGNWNNWAPLTGSYESLINQEMFYKTYLLGSQYKYCYYDILTNTNSIKFGTLMPKYDILNKSLTFTNANQEILITVTEMTPAEYTGFRVVLSNANSELYTIMYSINTGKYKETNINIDNVNTFRNLTIKLTSKAPFVLDHFGVFYDFDNKFHTDSDSIILKDSASGKIYRLGAESGRVILEPAG